MLYLYKVTVDDIVDERFSLDVLFRASSYVPAHFPKRKPKWYCWKLLLADWGFNFVLETLESWPEMAIVQLCLV